MRDKLQGKIAFCNTSLFCVVVGSPKCCEISCKEGMVHSATYLQLDSQRHCEIVRQAIARQAAKKKLRFVTPVYSVQWLQTQKCCKISWKEGMLHSATYLQLVLLQAQKCCEISCKEGMLHSATYLQLDWQRHCKTSCKEKLHFVTPVYSVQFLQAQKCCEISWKEGMLHSATYLQLVSQRHCETSLQGKIAFCNTSLFCAVVASSKML